MQFMHDNESAKDLHDDAMVFAEGAMMAARDNQIEQARVDSKKAFGLELQAARKVAVEPGRSILYRSAAWLAYHAGMYQEAIDAAEAGLNGDPSSMLRSELETVLVAAQQSKVELVNGSREETEAGGLARECRC